MCFTQSECILQYHYRLEGPDVAIRVGWLGLLPGGQACFHLLVFLSYFWSTSRIRLPHGSKTGFYYVVEMLQLFAACHLQLQRSCQTIISLTTH